MKSNKKKLIIISVIIIIIVAVTVIVLTLSGDNEIRNIDLYGSWSSTKLETYLDNKLTNTVDKSGYTIQIFDNKIITMCYFKDTKAICEDIKYSYAAGYITIEKNDLYLNGTLKVGIKDNILSLEDKLSDSTKTIIYFRKE